MLTILELFIEKLKMFPIFGIFSICIALFLLVAWFCYYDKVEWSYFLMLLLFLNISTVINFNFSFLFLSDEKYVLLIVWYLGFFSLICYKRQKKLSFFFLYFAIYLFYFYCVYNDKVNISSILLSYMFYLYHWYFTFTQRFILRSYSVVKVFLYSYSLVRISIMGVSYSTSHIG